MKGKEEVSETTPKKKRQVNYQILWSKNWLKGSFMSSHIINKNHSETKMNSLQTISK